MQSRKTFPNNSCSDPWEQIFLIWAFFEQLKKTSSHLWILLLGVTIVEIHTREADRVNKEHTFIGVQSKETKSVNKVTYIEEKFWETHQEVIQTL